MSNANSRPVARLVAALTLGTLLLALPSTPAPAESTSSTPAAVTPYSLVVDRDVNDRLAQPEDRYALAGGCYTMQSEDGTWVGRNGNSLVSAGPADATPFHLQATQLGEYLIASNEGPDTSVDGAWWDVRRYVSSQRLTVAPPTVTPLVAPPTVSFTFDADLAEAPSQAAEWELVAAGADGDRRSDVGQAYIVQQDAGRSTLGTFTFHHVADDDPSDDDSNGTACADWPEVQTNTAGRPSANPAGPAAAVQGFFESHVHGMAFEFLGGEARCGRPWHPYGVEFALVDCEDHGHDGRTAALDYVVAGQAPGEGHDVVGWPTFGYWPNPESLTHEQYYWRWLERAYLGGLRLSVNLFVENSVLCEAFPLKRNSCNEMDGVRLQAKRLFELQDYIDAQSGGPGEGWLRIVTDPAQAREVINAGRLAVVMGIEVSELFDCRAIADMPQCSEADIDDRLQEVFDMGVRQMELINKFDNGLSGVTGDGGTTGVVVNQGNRYATGHYWDMLSCPETADGHDHEHDKTQPNFSDDVPDGGQEEVDVLAGAILQGFAPTRGFVAPVYPAGPHCNSRGLTTLGTHLIEQMVAKGMVVDPDHMSAAGMREAIDHIEEVLIPAEHEAAHDEGRPAIQPALISSHSWGNDAIYQDIYRLHGVIGSRTASADRFTDRWAERRAWAQELAPSDSLFGLGYGADTNGLGGQPGPRSNPAVPLAYDADGWQAPIGDVTIYQQTSGTKTYDINTHGVAHYGLFADWFAELALSAEEKYADLGGADAIITDMLNGPEAYLQMWERAVYGGNDCVSDQSHLQTQDLHAALGGNVDGFLEAIGQPASRDGAVYTYCATDATGHPIQATVTFDTGGRAAEILEVPYW